MNNKNNAINLKKTLQSFLLVDTGEEATYLDDICMLIIEKAVQGDVAAFEAIKNAITDNTINFNLTITVKSENRG